MVELRWSFHRCVREIDVEDQIWTQVVREQIHREVGLCYTDLRSLKGFKVGDMKSMKNSGGAFGFR